MTTRYRISVKGRLDASWSDRMAGLRITLAIDPEGPVTTLEGPVRDQSELTGLRDQYTTEVYYRWQLTPRFAVTPTLQLLVNPALDPERDRTWIFGVRARLAL